MKVLYEPEFSIIDVEINWGDLKKYLKDSFDPLDTVIIHFNPRGMEDVDVDCSSCSVCMSRIWKDKTLTQALHSLTGPAAILNGNAKFCLHGELVSFDNWIEHALIYEKEKALLRLKYG